MQDWRTAIHENLVHGLGRVGSLSPRTVAERSGPWLLMDAGPDYPQFNVGLVVGPPGEAKDAIAEALAWYDRHRVPFHLLLRAGADAPLIAAACERGLAEAGREPSMLLTHLPQARPTPPGLVVRAAVNAGDVALYASVDGPAWREIALGLARSANEQRGFTMLLGLHGGAPVATALALVTGELVGVYNVNVHPEFRRLGFGGALTRAAIAVGEAAGCRVATLQSTPMGYSLYKAMGFATVEEYVSVALPRT
ncbi:MAG: GNAT family N-acetyltransferase [Dehalococcoidia bacterium]|nr:GNAT family N-acetyltransferase [Dehalococcoidia bacterium]